MTLVLPTVPFRRVSIRKLAWLEYLYTIQLALARHVLEALHVLGVQRVASESRRLDDR